MPHSEETLALLVNVHLVGGNKDLTNHLSGLTLRVRVVQRLIDILRASGYQCYEPDGVNAVDKVARRMHEQYTRVYGEATFTPAAVAQAVRVHEKTGLSLVQDKVATPPEALQFINTWQHTTRPAHIVAERSAQSQSNIHENYAAVFAKYGNVNITTGSTMTQQFVPWYLGMAFPFTLPCAVGGYDVPHHARWRRPEDADLPFPRACMDVWTKISDCNEAWASHSVQSLRASANPALHIAFSGKNTAVGPACEVKLFDLTRGLPQRIEGQFRRHWSFTPALWNLYFRERINLGGSLRVKSDANVQSTADAVDTDAAIAAAELLKKLDTGYYMDRGKRRKINGDYSKLIFAENHCRRGCWQISASGAARCQGHRRFV